MSKHEAKVVNIKLNPHSGSDNLSVVEIGGFTCVCRTEDWQGITKACYIPPDTIVNGDVEPFKFLGSGPQRVKAKRLRSVWSLGLLVPCPDDCQIGDDLWDYYKLEHYEPEVDSVLTGDCIKTPAGFGSLPKFDVENGRSPEYNKYFSEGEDVWVSEKLHGANMSVGFLGGELCVHSRTQWPKQNESNMFWQAYKNTSGLNEFMRDFPEHLIYGEAYGKVKGYPYDTKGHAKFRTFAIRKPDFSFMDVYEYIGICQHYGIPTVPSFGEFKFSMALGTEMCQGQSLIGNHHREGVVINPLKERVEYGMGRVILKFINPAYLEKN